MPDDKTEWLVYPQPKSFLVSLFERFSVHAKQYVSGNSPATTVFAQLPYDLKVILREMLASARVRSGERMALAPYMPVVE
jgi:hypothetical protein